MSTLSMTPSSPEARPELLAQRVRHPLRFRQLIVNRVERLTPHLVRITLAGEALEGFVSLGFDDHVKVFFPDPVTGVLTIPTASAEGPVWPEGARPTMRDYTPHHFDPVARTLQIDFALHQPGVPATEWAAHAQVGQRLGVGGPRGSLIVPTGFDWHLLMGDDTALPAIARRLAELPAGARAEVFIEVDGPDDHLALPSAATLNVQWVHRSSAEAGTLPLLDALRRTAMPAGVFHSWIGCESTQAKALRAYLTSECLANPLWIRASSYWRKGSVDTHESLDT